MRQLLVILLLTSTTFARAATFIVGDNSPECTHQTLQSAITAAAVNGPDVDLIYVTQAIDYNNIGINISDQSVWLFGGHTDCTLDTQDGRTSINGVGINSPNPDSVFELFSPGPDVPGDHQIILQNLTIAFGATDFDGGGGIELAGTGMDLIMINSVLGLNASNHGGGLFIYDSDETVEVFIRDSGFFGNVASDNGGALSCIGGATISMTGQTEIVSNDADRGAGIHLDGCELSVEDSFRAEDNIAQSDGGALLIENGGRFHDLDHVGSQGAAEFISNQTGHRGGAVAISGLGSSLTLHGPAFIGNHAVHGGGVAAFDSATAFVAAAPSQEARCELNQVSSLGACLYLSNNASAVLAQARVIGNAGTSIGGTMYSGPDSFIFAESLVIAGNSTGAFGANNGEGIAHFLTVADNSETAFSLWNESSLELHSSIVEDPGQALSSVEAGSTFSNRCVASRDGQGLQGGNENQVIPVGEDIPFIDRLAGNYRLNLTDPEATFYVDYCDGPAPGFADLDGVSRPFDLDAVANGIGHYDLGAYEIGDLIFVSGF